MSESLRTLLAPLIIWLSNLLNHYDPRFLAKLKTRMLKVAGVGFAGPALISSGFQCLSPRNVKIARSVSLGHNNVLWAFQSIEIGEFVHTARDLLIVAGSHDIASYEALPDQGVVIGPGCWIGARVTILGGVRVGKGSVIGAGSVVNRSLPDWSVAVGNPARVVRVREPSAQIHSPFGMYSPDDLSLGIEVL